ncbi:heat shock protein 23-like [Condylostylus longicornis]|uniref:heat shock protein 23-like n=1 Tax=Condylostylus longicornis TaxID=2530218 RepID=UPI00244E1B44|nr:heat shock protein 23-like [Condylostylus longicornis]
MSVSSSTFNLFEPWEIQPTKRRLCIGNDRLPYDYDVVPMHLVSYLSTFPELRRKKSGQIKHDFKNNSDIKGNEYQMCLKVSNFKPNEISVKVKDEDVIIECKHEEERDKYGAMSRHFIKRFKLPDEYSLDNLSSYLSSDGVLIIRAPKKLAGDSNERIVHIQQTGPAYLNVKNSS